MELFGGEKYSKEAFKDAEKEAGEATEEVHKNPWVGRGFYSEGTSSWTQLGGEWHETPVGKREREAHERLKQLLASGHKEALILNKEYDRLLKQAQEAVKAVEEFEIAKLGMHEETLRSSNEEAQP